MYFVLQEFAYVLDENFKNQIWWFEWDNFSHVMESFKYISSLLNIHGVVTLILGSLLKLKHDKGSEVGMSFMIQTHFHKCVRMQENEFQYSQMDFHFESWEVHLMS